MSGHIPETTQEVIVDATLDMFGYPDLINHYAIEMTPQQFREFTDSVRRMLKKVVSFASELGGEEGPSEVLEAYVAGFFKGKSEGMAEGYEDGYMDGLAIRSDDQGVVE